MKKTVLVLAALAASASADGVVLDRPLYIPATDDLLQYDDGTANWLSWGGLYRGVWFDLDDFIPGSPGGYLMGMEYWFFHHSSYPWDTASFFAELYSGDVSAPVTMLDQTSVTAVHYQPVDIFYSILVGNEFWGLVNTEMSAGGWPAILGDNTPQPVSSHSFFSDDFMVWEPWVIQGPTANDYFVRAEGPICLTADTWAGVKCIWR